MKVQKICGILQIIAGVLSIILTKDITFAILVVPFGLFLTFTKKKLD